MYIINEMQGKDFPIVFSFYREDIFLTAIMIWKVAVPQMQ